MTGYREVLHRMKGRRNGPRLLVIATVIGLVGLYFIPAALAVHDIKFQLDGDVSASTTTHVGTSTQALDWDSFFDTSGNTISGSLTGGFTNADFQRDFRAKNAAGTCSPTGAGTFCTADRSTFATGSKDTLNVSPGWQCNVDHNVNSKIDIMNAYALAFTNPVVDPTDGKHHQLLYFGMEKNKDTGDNNVAFWFLQSGADCESTGGNTPWTGTHTDGDILIVSEFTNGGGVSTITAYRWNGGAGGSLGTTAVANGGDCKTNLGGDTICATTNAGPNAVTGTISTPWLTANFDDGVDHSLRATEFFEGGIDLTATSLGGKCFNTFVGDTRSSQSLTATLFDYARGELGECNVSVTTTPQGVTGGTTKLSDTGAITDLADISGTDSAGNVGPTPTGTMSFFLCGPLTSAAGCVDPDGTAVTGNPVTLGACSPAVTGHACATSGNVRSLVTAGGIGTYCFRAVYDPLTDPNYGTKGGSFDGANECFTVTASASIATQQRWLPNDKATVTADGGTVAGNVTWVLYVGSANCTTGTGVTTVDFGPTDVNASGVAVTNNTTFYTSNQTISWRATFHSTNGVGSGDPSHCETSSIANYNNDIGS
jgi:hypothetical protein